MAELVVGYGASSARGLIKMIMAAVQTAKRNKKQCRELEERAVWTGGRRRGWRGRRSRSDVRSRKVVECEAELVAPPSYCIANRFTRDWAVQRALSSVDLASAAGVFARGQLAAMELLFTAVWKDGMCIIRKIAEL
uniref:Uncharacterized protein n=1 Tax=Oryza barthii TaxID=65489 RepID=A0A0D3HPS0_9ORYZ